MATRTQTSTQHAIVDVVFVDRSARYTLAAMASTFDGLDVLLRYAATSESDDSASRTRLVHDKPGLRPRRKGPRTVVRMVSYNSPLEAVIAVSTAGVSLIVFAERLARLIDRAQTIKSRAQTQSILADTQQMLQRELRGKARPDKIRAAAEVLASIASLDVREG